MEMQVRLIGKAHNIVLINQDIGFVQTRYDLFQQAGDTRLCHLQILPVSAISCHIFSCYTTNPCDSGHKGDKYFYTTVSYSAPNGWHINCIKSGMKKSLKSPDVKLRNELVLVVVIKLLILMTIWWFFFKDQRANVDIEAPWPETSTASKHSKTGESL